MANRTSAEVLEYIEEKLSSLRIALADFKERTDENDALITFTQGRIDILEDVRHFIK